jgi:hypothetical protein
MSDANKAVIPTGSRSKESKGGMYEKNLHAGLSKIAASPAIAPDHHAAG